MASDTETTTIPYLLDPAIYAQQIKEKGGTLKGFLEYYRTGALDSSAMFKNAL